MGFNTIEKHSFLYTIGLITVKFWHNKIFYKKIIVIHPENIPEKGNIIFTPNHQNALMDALGPLCNIDRQLVFLARADIFNRPKIASVLYFLKILPIFRIRDGFETLKKNNQIFIKIIDVIEVGNGLVILPEGNHEGIHRLRPLKKGFARIAFKTEEEFNFSKNLQIVPIGLFYDDYEKFRSTFVIHFGVPIPVSDFYQTFKQNPAKAILDLKDRLTESIKPLMINIESENNYRTFNEIRKFRQAQKSFETKGKSDTDERFFIFQKEITDALAKVDIIDPLLINALNKQIVEYLNLLSSEEIDYLTVEKGALKIYELVFYSALLIVGFPFFLFGYLNNLLPLALTNYFSAKPKDKQFHSSVKFVVSIILFPLFYVFQVLILAIITQSAVIASIYALSLPVSAILSWSYYVIYFKIKSRWKLNLLKWKKAGLYKKLKNLHDAISENITAVINTAASNL